MPPVVTRVGNSHLPESGSEPRRRRRAAARVSVAAIGLVGGALVLADAAAAIRSGEPPSHVYGSPSRPHVSFTVEEPETRGGPCYLALEILAENGVETRAATSDLAPPATCRPTRTGFDVTGTSRLQGRDVRYRAAISLDWSTMEWEEPASVSLADGSTHELAGHYARLSESTKVSLAKAAFNVVDRELNAIYRRLVVTRDPSALQALRVDQRRWLTFRDFTIFDGDNAGTVGPGTSPHLREQSRRTLARIGFLASLLDPPRTDAGDTVFSNGRGGTFAIRRVGEAIAFSAAVRFPSLNAADAPSSLPCALSGLARAAEGRAWLAAPTAMVAADRTWTPEPLRLVFDPEGRLRVEAAGGTAGLLARVLRGTYVPQRRVTPAEAPLRSLLWQLPARAFDDTTEGLADAERQSLVLTGAGGDFTVADERPDRLVLRHQDGHVTVARLAGADGSAVVAVEQTNGRNLSLHLWRQAGTGGPFARWEDALPVLPVEAFFAESLGADAATIKARSRQAIHIDEPGGLRLSLRVQDDDVDPDYAFALAWDGFGFVADRIRAR